MHLIGPSQQSHDDVQNVNMLIAASNENSSQSEEYHDACLVTLVRQIVTIRVTQ